MTKKEKRSLVMWVLDKYTRWHMEDWPAAEVKRHIRDHYNRKVSKRLIRQCQRAFVPHPLNLWPINFN